MEDIYVNTLVSFSLSKDSIDSLVEALKLIESLKFTKLDFSICHDDDLISLSHCNNYLYFIYNMHNITWFNAYILRHTNSLSEFTFELTINHIRKILSIIRLIGENHVMSLKSSKYSTMDISLTISNSNSNLEKDGLVTYKAISVLNDVVALRIKDKEKDIRFKPAILKIVRSENLQTLGFSLSNIPGNSAIKMFKCNNKHGVSLIGDVIKFDNAKLLEKVKKIKKSEAESYPLTFNIESFVLSPLILELLGVENDIDENEYIGYISFIENNSLILDNYFNAEITYEHKGFSNKLRIGFSVNIVKEHEVINQIKYDIKDLIKNSSLVDNKTITEQSHKYNKEKSNSCLALDYNKALSKVKDLHDNSKDSLDEENYQSASEESQDEDSKYNIEF